MNNVAQKEYDILSIDAWGNSTDGYDWNSVYYTGKTLPESALNSTKSILKNLRDQGLLSDKSKGKIKVEEIGDDRFVVSIRYNDEPIFSIVPSRGD